MANSPESAGNYPDQFEQPGRSKEKKGTSTNTGENGCKGCKCKKSECLKLYCDCFAGGTYCTDSCCCRGCLNTAEYEDAVLEKKKQIESRNPLAFLPKIVPQSNALPSNNNRTEDANVVTPSRARHRRGCNCKKSMCMKKYCECYKANAGCSNGCRCEGCKNEYGTKECLQSSPCSSIDKVHSPGSLYLDFDIFLEEGTFPATTNHSNYLWQMLPMENESHNANINVPSNHVGPAPPEQGPVLQPQVHIPRHQQLLPQNIQNHIAPQPNNLLPSVSGLAQPPTQNIGHNNLLGSQGQSSFLPSLLHQPNNGQHSTHFMLQRPQSSIVHQEQTPMAVGHQQPMLTAQQQQHQLIMGPQSNDATDIQVHVPYVADTEHAHRLFSQQNSLTSLFSQYFW